MTKKHSQRIREWEGVQFLITLWEHDNRWFINTTDLMERKESSKSFASEIDAREFFNKQALIT